MRVLSMLSFVGVTARCQLCLAGALFLPFAVSVCGQSVSPSSGGSSEKTVTATSNAATTPAAGTMPATTSSSPVAAVANKVSTGAQNVLAVLNRQRSRQGLRSLRYDASLQAVAERRARQMASMGLKSHPPGSFAPGRYEGVGWSSSFSPNGVHACYTSNPNMRVAGAAMVRGRDGMYFAVVYR